MIIWIQNGKKCRKSAEEIVSFIRAQTTVNEIVAYEEDSTFAGEVAERCNVPLNAIRKGPYDNSTEIRDQDMDEYADLILNVETI